MNVIALNVLFILIKDVWILLIIILNTLKKIHKNVQHNKKLLRNNFDETVYNYYKSKVLAHLQQLFGLK